MRATVNIKYSQAKHLAVRTVEQAPSLIATGLAYRYRQIRTAILSELAETTVHGELLKKPVELLDKFADTIRTLGRRLRDGFAYDTLLELQTEDRAIFPRMDGAQ